MNSNNKNEKKNQQVHVGGGPRGFARPKEKPQNAKATLKRLIKYISSSKILLITLLFVVVFFTLANVFTNIAIKNVVATLGIYNSETKLFTIEPDKDAFFKWTLILCILHVLYCVLQYFSSLLGAYLSVKTVRKLRNDLFKKIVKLPIAYVDTHRHGDIMSRMTNDVDNIANAVSQSITSLISGILTLIGCLAIMIYYSPLLTLVSMVVLVLTLIVTGFMSKHMGPLFAKQQGILGNLNSQTEEMVSSYKTVIAYNYQEKANEKFRQASKEYTKVGMRAQFIGGSMGPVMNFIGNVGYFLVCLMGAIFIYYGMGKTLLGVALDASIVIMFLSTTKQFTRPITEIAQLYSSLLTALAGAERVFAVLDEQEEDFSKKEDFDLETIKGDIDFRHIAFGYTPDKQVLKDFNVDVYSGHKIALVGATGSGKTTIVNLLLRFYDIDNGEIYIDDHNIFNISKKDLRSAISIVLQDPVLFSDTIENNVRYGRSAATDEEVDQALEFANCTSFVSKLENGKKTMLTEGATNISQGQRQLLTIARAILANPKILILDEATSSVDTRTEKHIQDAMVNLMKNRTSLIIAHRLSTIQDADLIVVIDGGVVIEMGNHNELIAHQGKYYSLYMTQFAGKEI